MSKQMMTEKAGKVLTLLDLEDLRRIHDDREGRHVRRWAVVVGFVALAGVALFFEQQGRLLKKAVVQLAAVAEDEKAKRLAADEKVKKYDHMMKVVIDHKRLARPVRISGELIVMIAGDVREVE